MNNMTPPYFWQTSQWENVMMRYHAQTFPHALLLTGEAGLGKKAFAQQVAKLLLCESPENCQPCAACQLLARDNHPDFINIALQDKEKSIGVDTIRDILPQCYETSQRGKGKVVMIMAAELLNHAACNALLKTLEEPEHNIYFILVCDNPYQLPQTLRSRCQMMRFYPQDLAQTREWLKVQTNVAAEAGEIETVLSLTHGIPLQALAWLNGQRLSVYQQVWREAIDLVVDKKEPLAIAQLWQKYPLELLLHALQSLWMSSMQQTSDNGFLHQFSQKMREKKSRYQLGQDCQVLLNFRQLIYRHASFNLGIQVNALCVRLGSN